MHIDEALKVLNFAEEKNQLRTFKKQKNLLEVSKEKKIISHRDFTIQLIPLKKGKQKKLVGKGKKRCLGGVVLQGKLVHKKITFETFESFIIPPELKLPLSFSAQKNSLLILIN